MAEKKKQWKQAEDGSFVVELKVPFEHNKETISQIKLRGIATVQDIEAMDRGKGEVEKSLYMMAELSGLSLTCLRKLRAVDYGAVAEAMAEVLGNESPATGGTS